MELKTRNVSEMSESEKNKLLIKDGWLFFIIAGIFLIAGFLLIMMRSWQSFSEADRRLKSQHKQKAK